MTAAIAPLLAVALASGIADARTSELPAPKISEAELNAGNPRTLSVVRLPWGENLFNLLKRQQRQLTVFRAGSPSDFYCAEYECHLVLHLVDRSNRRTTKESCGLMFEFKFDRRTQRFSPANWRAAKVWDHKEVELIPFFGDRYATYDCGLK
jgi:hypothetical protein